jgi:hypothetical protein
MRVWYKRRQIGREKLAQNARLVQAIARLVQVERFRVR